MQATRWWQSGKLGSRVTATLRGLVRIQTSQSFTEIHTSGLVRYEFKDQFTKDLTANPEKTWKPAELVAYLLDEKPPFGAGKGWEYSDTNYIVLGMIIEKVTGRSFYDEADRRLLKPLRLTDTIPQNGPRLRGVVQGYAGDKNPFGGEDEMIRDGQFVINPQFEWTGGGCVPRTLGKPLGRILIEVMEVLKGS